ncbi:hypothetical protein REPUB_Repub09cG0043900 [Reevesia pubescens]
MSLSEAHGGPEDGGGGRHRATVNLWRCYCPTETRSRNMKLGTTEIDGPISGGSKNPARTTIGPEIASAHYKGIWVYVVGPVTGTLAGASESGDRQAGECNLSTFTFI